MKKLFIIIPFFFIGLSAGTVLAGNHQEEPKVTICHATASETNPYVQQNVNQSSILNDSGHGHSGVNAGDIIPPFADFPGNNWDVDHQAIYNNDCNVPCPPEPPVIEPPAPPTEPPVIEPPVETPPVEVPPVVEPPVPPNPPITLPPSGGGGGDNPPTPPGNSEQSNHANTTGGGGIGFVPSSVPSTQPSPVLSVTEPTVCTHLVDFSLDSGVHGDGKVMLRWTGGNDTKFVVYGTNPDALNMVTSTTDNQIEISGLQNNVNYWFGVSNACSAAPLIDPLP